MRNACSTVVFKPNTLERVFPRRHRSSRMAVGSVAVASRTSGAEFPSPKSNLEATLSIAIMRPAPAIAAPLTADRPIPQTDHRDRRSGFDLCGSKHRPAPVITASNYRCPVQRHVGLIFTTERSCTSIYSANDEDCWCAVTTSPSASFAVAPRIRGACWGWGRGTTDQSCGTRTRRRTSRCR